MKHVFWLLFVAAVAPALAACSALPGLRPASGAGSRCRAPEGQFAAPTPLARQMDALLSRYADYGLSGSILVVRGGEVLLNRSYGFADVEARTANSPETLYDVGSLAKTFTAAAILDLEARGRLSVHDSVTRHLPALSPDKQAITIHHLLTHTAGLPLDPEQVGVTAADTTEQVLEKIGAAPLLHPPGSAYRYSNAGYGLLALIVERVSGLTWQAYVRRRLLSRAGLRNTFLYGERLPPGVMLARGYMGPSEEEARLQPLLTHSGNSPIMWGKLSLGAGGVLTPVGDLYRWWCALRAGPLLPEVQRAKLFSIQAANQGYGWNIRQEGGTTTRISRGGLRGSYESLVSYYPASDSLIVYGLNRNISNLWSGVVWNNLARALAGEVFPVPPAIRRLTHAAVARLAGEYRLPSGGALFFRDISGVLHVGAEGQDAIDALLHGAGRPSQVERMHALSARVVTALAERRADELERLTRMPQQQLEALTEQWGRWMGETGGLVRAELLGSTLGFENHTRTFLRLHGPTSARVVRLLWDAPNGRLVAWGDDIPLPAFLRLWPQSETQFVSYDFQSDRVIEFGFGADGTVTARSRSGEVLLTATRSEPAASTVDPAPR